MMKIFDSRRDTEVRQLRNLLQNAIDERQIYYQALLDIRWSVITRATDVVWMKDGIETVVDHINATLKDRTEPTQ